MGTSRWLVCIGVGMILLVGGCATGTQTAAKYSKKEQAEATRRLGEAYFREGKYVDALRELLNAERMVPKDPLVHNDLGLVYFARGRKDLAVTHFRRALELKPDYAEAQNNLGLTYLELKEWDRAIGYFKEITDNLLYRTPHYAFSNLGLAYYYKGDYEASIRHYRHALEMRPGFMKGLQGLARSYTESGRPERAVAAIDEILREKKGAAGVYLELGRAHMRMGAYGKARRALNTVLRMSPEGRLAAQAVEMLGSMGG